MRPCCKHRRAVYVPQVCPVGLSPGSGSKPESIFREHHEGIVAVAIVSPYQRAPATNVDHPVVIEGGRTAITVILIKLKRPPAAITLPSLRAVIASLAPKDRAMPDHHAHPAVPVDKSCATEIIKRAVLDEDCLLTAPARIIGPRVIAVLADAFPSGMTDIDTAYPRPHREIAMIDNAP